MRLLGGAQLLHFADISIDRLCASFEHGDGCGVTAEVKTFQSTGFSPRVVAVGMQLLNQFKELFCGDPAEFFDCTE